MEEEESSCGGHFGFLGRLKENILRQSRPPGCFLLGNVVYVFLFSFFGRKREPAKTNLEKKIIFFFNLL